MNLNYIRIFFIICLFFCTANTQVVKKDTKLRVKVGMASLGSGNVNETIDDLKKVSLLINSNSIFLPPKFERHILFSFDYETKIDNMLSYMFTLEYHNEDVIEQSVDYFRSISQAFSFEITYIVVGASLVYYIPAFYTNFGDAQFFVGLGFDMFYSDLDLYHYYYEDPKEGEQTAELKAISYNPGGKFFGGFEIPFTPSIFIQLQAGYSYRVIRNLSGKVNINKTDPFDEELFKKDSYNLSGLWGNIGIAYLF